MLRLEPLLILALISGPAVAGTWTRTSPTSLAFRGEIVSEDVERFNQIYRPTDTTVVLNSTGGSIAGALSIARVLVVNRRLITIAQEICASSCANYLFLAGKTRILDHAILGFHGNMRAYMNTEGFRREWDAASPEVRHRIGPFHRENLRQETAFMKTIGADQRLFDKTQLENDAGLYDVYLPSARTLANYGITVIGEQDRSYNERHPELSLRYDPEFIPASPPSSTDDTPDSTR